MQVRGDGNRSCALNPDRSLASSPVVRTSSVCKGIIGCDKIVFLIFTGLTHAQETRKLPLGGSETMSIHRVSNSLNHARTLVPQGFKDDEGKGSISLVSSKAHKTSRSPEVPRSSLKSSLSSSIPYSLILSNPAPIPSMPAIVIIWPKIKPKDKRNHAKTNSPPP
jgi:hypothetical protein